MIPIANPKLEVELFEEKIVRAINEVLHSPSFILGKSVEKFEDNFAKACCTKYALGVANGTDAIILALRALGVGRGHEVITTCHTALATIAAICATGATPVVVDINEETMLIDERLIKKNITRKTKAVIAVHLYGLSCQIETVKEVCDKHNLFLIEDCAQAFGTTYKGKQVGSIGDIGTFSFYPTKNLGAIGDGGAVVTNDAGIHYKLQLQRQYGWDKCRVSQCPGINSRLDEIQAAILNIKLHNFDILLQQRRKIALFYIEELSRCTGLRLPTDTQDSKHSFHLFVIRHDNREKLIKALSDNGIGAGIHYPELVTDHPGYSNLIKYNKRRLSNAKKVIKEIVSIPIYPGLSLNNQMLIAKSIKDFDARDKAYGSTGFDYNVS